MSKINFFSKIEQDVHHRYRNDLNHAESTEDVKKFFVYAVRDLFQQAFAGRIDIDYNDIRIDQDTEAGFTCSSQLKENKEVHEAWANSDLPEILARFAENAINHIKHLEDKHPDKTEAKMYPKKDHSGRFYTNPPAGRR